MIRDLLLRMFLLLICPPSTRLVPLLLLFWMKFLISRLVNGSHTAHVSGGGVLY